MIARRSLTAIVAALASAAAVGAALAANNPPRFDPRDEQVGAPGTPRLGIDSGSPSTAESPMTGNPLWGIPLKSLSATRRQKDRALARRAQ